MATAAAAGRSDSLGHRRSALASSAGRLLDKLKRSRSNWLVDGDDCDDARTAELRRPAVNGTRRDAGGARADGDGLLGQGPPNQLGQLQEAALGRSNDMWDALGPPLHGPDVAGGRARGETDHIVAAATAASRSRSSLAPSRPSASAGCRPLDAAGGLGLRAARCTASWPRTTERSPWQRQSLTLRRSFEGCRNRVGRRAGCSCFRSLFLSRFCR